MSKATRILGTRTIRPIASGGIPVKYSPHLTLDGISPHGALVNGYQVAVLRGSRSGLMSVLVRKGPNLVFQDKFDGQYSRIHIGQ